MLFFVCLSLSLYHHIKFLLELLPQTYFLPQAFCSKPVLALAFYMGSEDARLPFLKCKKQTFSGAHDSVFGLFPIQPTKISRNYPFGSLSSYSNLCWRAFLSLAHDLPKLTLFLFWVFDTSNYEPFLVANCITSRTVFTFDYGIDLLKWMGRLNFLW